MTRTRKPRRKATTDIGRSIMQRERQRLAREQAELAEKLTEDARRAGQAHGKRSRQNPQAVAAAALQRSIVSRVGAVLSSEGVNVPIQTEVREAHQSINAWTNFDLIHLGYHLFDDIKLTAAIIRGMAYHEGGHCRWTVPMPDLTRLARVEGGYSDLADDEFRNLRAPGFTANQLHWAWNALEDQRMETAVVSDSPRKAGYFTPMMLSELANTPEKAAANWPLMVWRKYLPKHVRDGAKAMFLAAHPDDGDDLVREVQGITTRYVLAQTATAMFDAVIEMAAVLQRIKLDYSITDAGHGHQRSKGEKAEDGLSIPVDPSMEAEAAEEAQEAGKGKGKPAQGQPQPGPGAAEGDDDADGDAEGDDAGDANEADSHSKSGGSSGTHESDRPVEAEKPASEPADDDDEAEAADEAEEAADEGLSQEDLDEAIADAEDERLQDKALDADVQAFNDAKNNAASNLVPYQGGVNTNPDDNVTANALAANLERAFQQATVNIAPSWQEEQRRGVLNVLRYETRRPGNVEFFRSYIDDGQPGHDIAVSVLLDYSGSMWNVTKELAQVAFASKAACDRLGIPCTVVLWDTEARVLWDANEKAEVLPTIDAMGGTNPRMALDDLDNQQYGKAKHVVLVMTDDEWSANSPMLTTYRAEDRVIVGLGYGGGDPRIAESMARKGANFAYSIEDLAEIPKHLEQALVSVI